MDHYSPMDMSPTPSPIFTREDDDESEENFEYSSSDDSFESPVNPLLKTNLLNKTDGEESNSSVTVYLDDLPFKIPVTEKCLKGYQLKELIGKGGYGTVNKGCHIDSGCNYAVKVMIVNQNNFEEFAKEAHYSKLFAENGIGPQFFGAWNCIESQIGIIVNELWDGSLKPKDILSQQLIDKLTFQILTMHRLGYIHTDILEKNVLVKRNLFGAVIDLTLTDFGLANTLEFFLKNPEWVKTMYEYQITTPSTRRYFIDKRMSLEDVQKSPNLLDYSLIYHFIKKLREFQNPPF